MTEEKMFFGGNDVDDMNVEELRKALCVLGELIQENQKNHEHTLNVLSAIRHGRKLPESA